MVEMVEILFWSMKQEELQDLVPRVLPVWLPERADQLMNRLRLGNLSEASKYGGSTLGVWQSEKQKYPAGFPGILPSKKKMRGKAKMKLIASMLSTSKYGPGGFGSSKAPPPDSLGSVLKSSNTFSS